MVFKDKHVVVTGGTGALGGAVTHALIAAGATCHIPAFEADPGAGHERIHITGGIDLTDEPAVTNFYGGLPGLWGSIHIAGGFNMTPLAETSKDDFMGQMTMNALTCFLCSREAARKIRSGGDSGGRIVNVSARPGVEPRQGSGMAAYTASKAAVAALTECLAEELAAERIWVNAVAPSILDTPANRAAMPKADFAAWPKVEEVAATIIHLVSPENGVTRGAVVPVYGSV